jgi:hypothetical protein
LAFGFTLPLIIGNIDAVAAEVRQKQTPPVRAVINDCPGLDSQETARLFNIEIRQQPSADPSGSPQATVARVSCPDSDTAELRVDDPLTGKTLMRTVAIKDTPSSARPRLLALALAELVYASWSELALRPVPVGPPDESSDKARLAAAEAVRGKMQDASKKFDLHLMAVGSAQFLFEGTGGVYGGGIRIAGDHPYHLGWTVDAIFEHGYNRVSLGSITTNVLSIGASLTGRYEVSIVILRGAAGFRTGGAWLTGTPSDSTTYEGRTVAGAFFGPMGSLGMDVKLPYHLILGVLVEGGYIAVPVNGTGGGETAASFGGPWVGVQLGFGVSL